MLSEQAMLSEHAMLSEAQKDCALPAKKLVQLLSLTDVDAVSCQYLAM